MSQSDDSSPGLDYIQSALEATCGALMMLESVREPTVGGTADDSAAQQHVSRAIASLHHAIEELRLAHDPDASIIGLGFVVRTGPQRVGKERRRPQSSPRRTA